MCLFSQYSFGNRSYSHLYLWKREYKHKMTTKDWKVPPDPQSADPAATAHQNTGNLSGNALFLSTKAPYGSPARCSQTPAGPVSAITRKCAGNR